MIGAFSINKFFCNRPNLAWDRRLEVLPKVPFVKVRLLYPFEYICAFVARLVSFSSLEDWIEEERNFIVFKFQTDADAE